MTGRDMRYTGLAALLALVPLMAAAQTYKWFDENGHTQFSDRPPPPGVKFERIDVKPPQPTPAAAPAAKPGQESSIAVQEREFRKRRLLAEEKEKEEEKKKIEAEARRHECEQAEQRVRDLAEPVAIYSMNKSGGRDYMSDETRASETAKAQQKVKEVCS